MYRGSPFRSTWTWVTLGLGMCKVCTEAVHCVSSPLQAFWRWSPFQAPFKPSALKASSLLQALFKPLWSLLQAILKPSEGEAPFKPPQSPLQRWKLQAPFKPSGTPFKPLQAPFKPSKGEAPLKPPWSSLQASLKPPSALKASSPLEALLKSFWSRLQAPLKPPKRPSSPLQAAPSEGEAFLKPSKGEAPFKPSWRVPSKDASLKVKPSSWLKGALREGPRKNQIQGSRAGKNELEKHKINAQSQRANE